jgi:hypothetical protein
MVTTWRLYGKGRRNDVEKPEEGVIKETRCERKQKKSGKRKRIASITSNRPMCIFGHSSIDLGRERNLLFLFFLFFVQFHDNVVE